ncbi:MAG: DUF2887 domain-containing protein [Thermosynechococcaceae cyanobacterium]
MASLKTDNLFYRLFQTEPRLFFELLGEPISETAGYQFTSEEVKQTSFRIDGIFTPPADTVELPLYFVEVMGYKDRQGILYPSLFSEIFLYLSTYKPEQDWRAVVIFTRRRLDPGLGQHYQEFSHGSRLQQIYLDEFSAEQIQKSVTLGIFELIVSTDAAVLTKGRRLIERIQSDVSDDGMLQKFLELVETIFVYKFPELSRREVESMFGLSDLKQTKVYQEALEEGRQEGRQEEGKMLLLQLLKHRFDVLPTGAEAQIQALSLPQIELLGKALFDFADSTDLTEWLQKNG